MLKRVVLYLAVVGALISAPIAMGALDAPNEAAACSCCGGDDCTCDDCACDAVGCTCSDGGECACDSCSADCCSNCCTAD